ncbi:15933_t:CDS:2 [Funneliformis geosporum]|uniref:15933_t:CDS:1 n=1 Tax=Funneliformis geosporum TaxID=1117311 RepID=A0A9W4WUV0_9GLOM|nr:15933_t:CDS:2 [Funneliformis geosporum]
MKLIDNNEKIKQQTHNISSEKVVNIPNSIIDQYNNSTVSSNLSLVTETSLRNNEIESNIKTVSSENDQQKIILRLELKSITDDSDEIEFTKNQNIKLDLIRDLQNYI